MQTHYNICLDTVLVFLLRESDVWCDVVGIQCRINHFPVNYHVLYIKVQQMCGVGVILMQTIRACILLERGTVNYGVCLLVIYFTCNCYAL